MIFFYIGVESIWDKVRYLTAVEQVSAGVKCIQKILKQVISSHLNNKLVWFNGAQKTKLYICLIMKKCFESNFNPD